MNKLVLVLITASFLSAGGAWAGCKITTGNCPAHSEISNLTDFADDYMGSGAHPLRCLARAKEYFDWCGGAKKGPKGPTGKVAAKFFNAAGTEVDHRLFP